MDSVSTNNTIVDTLLTISTVASLWGADYVSSIAWKQTSCAFLPLLALTSYQGSTGILKDAIKISIGDKILTKIGLSKAPSMGRDRKEQGLSTPDFEGSMYYAIDEIPVGPHVYSTKYNLLWWCVIFILIFLNATSYLIVGILADNKAFIWFSTYLAGCFAMYLVVFMKYEMPDPKVQIPMILFLHDRLARNIPCVRYLKTHDVSRLHQYKNMTNKEHLLWVFISIVFAIWIVGTVNMIRSNSTTPILYWSIFQILLSTLRAVVTSLSNGYEYKSIDYSDEILKYFSWFDTDDNITEKILKKAIQKGCLGFDRDNINTCILYPHSDGFGTFQRSLSVAIPKTYGSTIAECIKHYCEDDKIFPLSNYFLDDVKDSQIITCFMKIRNKIGYFEISLQGVKNDEDVPYFSLVWEGKANIIGYVEYKRDTTILGYNYLKVISRNLNIPHLTLTMEDLKSIRPRDSIGRLSLLEKLNG